MYLGMLILCTGLVHAQTDGTIVAWGMNDDSQCNVPAPNSGFISIVGSGYHSIGLKSDGTVVAWGRNEEGQCNVPAPNSDFIAIAGDQHSLGLKSEGTVVAWGYNYYGQCDVPAPNSDFIAVAGGVFHSLGLKSDGTVVAWGLNDDGQCNVPAPNSDFIATAGGGYHSLGLKSDGTVVAWGDNAYDQCNIPLPNEGFMAVDGGGYHSLYLKRPPVTPVEEHEYSDVFGTEVLTIVSTAPNPFSQSMGISFETRISDNVIMEIYDISGRNIKTESLGYLEPGQHQVLWYGCDESGCNLTSGLYFVRLLGTEGVSQTARVVLIH